MTSIRTPIPYAYVSIVNIVSKIHMVLVSLMAGTFATEHDDVDFVYTFMFSLIVSGVNALIFEGMLELHSQLSRPFGNDIWQFPTEDMLTTGRAASKAMIRTYDMLPESIHPRRPRLRRQNSSSSNTTPQTFSK